MVAVRRMQKLLSSFSGNASFNIICWLHRKRTGKYRTFKYSQDHSWGTFKNFSKNIRHLRVTVEEILKPVLFNCILPTFDNLLSYLEGLLSKNRTVKLRLEEIVWPIFIGFRFIRSSREAHWPLHIYTVKLTLPYFTAAGYWHYLRYATVYFIKMTKLPIKLLHKFFTG